jgi:hypothetical protein
MFMHLLSKKIMSLSVSSNARRGGGGDGREVPDPDGMDVERSSKRRCDSTLDVREDLVLTLHILEDRKTSPTQQGRGIRKIVDLYHDLSDLLNKAKKHSTIVNELNPAMIEEMDRSIEALHCEISTGLQIDHSTDDYSQHMT